MQEKAFLLKTCIWEKKGYKKFFSKQNDNCFIYHCTSIGFFYESFILDSALISISTLSIKL